MMGSTCTTPPISLYLKAINFKSCNLGSTCTPLSSDLGKSKLFNLLYGLLSRMGNTCTAPYIPLYFKSIS